MENLQKALIMAGSVFMFVIALSVAVFSYTTVTDVIDTIMTASENNDRSSEYFTGGNLDVTRDITKAEVINTILSMDGIDFTANGVIVNGMVFKKEDYATYAGRKEIEKNIARITGENFSVSYNFTRVPNEIYVEYTISTAI